MISGSITSKLAGVAMVSGLLACSGVTDTEPPEGVTIAVEDAVVEAERSMGWVSATVPVTIHNDATTDMYYGHCGGSSLLRGDELVWEPACRAIMDPDAIVTISPGEEFSTEVRINAPLGDPPSQPEEWAGSVTGEYRLAVKLYPRDRQDDQGIISAVQHTSNAFRIEER